MAFWLPGPPGSVVTLLPTAREGNHITLHTLGAEESRGERGSWEFTPSPGPPLDPLVSSGNAEILACAVALDDSQGLRVPCLLASTEAPDGELESAVLHVLAFSTQGDGDVTLVHCGRWSGIVPSREGLRILDGPTVVWSREKDVHLAVSSKPDTPPKWVTVAVGDEIERMWCYNMPEGGILMFVRTLGTLNSNDGAKQPPPRSKWLCLLVNKEESEETVKELPCRCYVPSNYGKMVVCMVVHHSWAVSDTGDMMASLEIAVGTQRRQVVVLRGGIPVHCITMETIPEELAVLKVSQ